ncbi:MAG TPA: FAD-dependent monooxygenase [Reyranella sp.]|jgi:flavin-dependent dehydrogenase
MTDVAIVGGGPAGAAAAIACAKAGLSTVLLEQTVAALATEDEPEESLGPDSVAQLGALGIDCAQASWPYIGITTGSHVTLFAGRSPAPGRHVRRSWLDDALRSSAIRAGAECRRGVEAVGIESRDAGATLLTSDGALRTRYVIDATGRRCWLARRLELVRQWRSPSLIAWRRVASTGGQPASLARFSPTDGGWSFVAPISPDRTVVTELRLARRGIDSLPSGARPTVVTWHVVRQLAGPGWCIAGDAAAAIDPAAGIGISFALRSGLAAAGAARACLSDRTAASVVAARYDEALLTEFTAAAEGLVARYRELGIDELAGTGRSYSPSIASSRSFTKPWRK